MFEKFTDRSRKVVAYAKTEATEQGADAVGTEHILYGLAKESSGVAHHALNNYEITAQKIREETKKQTQPGNGRLWHGIIDIYTPRTKDLFRTALAIAGRLHHNYVGTEHLLLAILEGIDSAAYTILNSFSKTLIGELKVNVHLLIGETETKFTFQPSQLFGKSVYAITTDSTPVGHYDAEADMIRLYHDMTLRDIGHLLSDLRSAKLE